MSDQKIKYGFFLLLVSLLILPCGGKAELNTQKPLVYLNHFYMTLDSTTYNSVYKSEFLKEFANFITRTVKADSSESWTGSFMFGEKTYLEIFSATENKEIGLCGIGFGIETENGVDALYERCQSLGVENTAKTIRHRDIEGKKIPWFNYFSINDFDSNRVYILNTWVMEYKYEYLKTKFPDINSDSLELTRKFYLQEDYKSDLLLKNIVEIELALDEPDINKITNELNLFGFQTEKEESVLILTGPEIKLIIRPKSENKSGVCRIKFSLTDKPYEQQTVQFGKKSKLILNSDKTAEWFISI